MLKQRADRHDKKSAEESECRQQHEHRCERKSRDRQPETKNRNPQRTQWNQSVFNFPSGKISRRQATQADTNRDSRLQKTSARRAFVQHVARVKHNVELQQSTQKEKISVAGHREV